MSLDIRCESPLDLPYITHVHNRSFGNEAEGRLVEALRKEGAFQPEMSLVAVQADKIVGHVLFSDLIVDANDGAIKAAALAPVAVLPEFQNQGIGSKLIRGGLVNIKELGYTLSVVLGEPNYYSRFGFDVELGQKIDCPFHGPYLMAKEISEGVLGNIDSIKVTYSEAFSTVD